MPGFELEIKLLTPIWTGDATGRANGLKMSGLVGGMRHNFEMLIRKHGGHTCNITGLADQRCNYEQNENICPACAVFGCTGLQRSFKIKLVLDSIPMIAPLKDPRIKNRKHDGTEYNFSCMIAKWLILSAGIRNSVKEIPDDQEATLLRQINIIWPKGKNAETTLKVINLNNLLSNRTIVLQNLLNYLLYFMSGYSGLGAKIDQGWGVFQLAKKNSAEFNSLVKAGEMEMARLIEFFEYPACRDTNLPCAEDCFAVTWPLRNKDLGFSWNRNTIPTDKPFFAYRFWDDLSIAPVCEIL